MYVYTYYTVCWVFCLYMYVFKLVVFASCLSHTFMQKWFQMFIPKRLEIDQSLAVSEVDFTTNKHNAVDTSKIIIMKPSKEKK